MAEDNSLLPSAIILFQQSLLYADSIIPGSYTSKDKCNCSYTYQQSQRTRCLADNTPGLLLHEPHCRVRCGVVEITEFTLGVIDMSGVIASLTGRTLTGESGL